MNGRKVTHGPMIDAFFDYWKCPNTGKIIEGIPGDDKVICYCGRPARPDVREADGIHHKSLLKPVTEAEMKLHVAKFKWLVKPT